MSRRLLKTMAFKNQKNKIEFPQRKMGQALNVGNEAIVNGDARFTGTVKMPDESQIDLFQGVVFCLKDRTGKALKGRPFKTEAYKK